jgi:hypothetical protein
LSTANITNIQMSGLSVLVTFSCNHGREERTYQYFDLEAVRGILAGEDPSQWSGIQVSGGGSGSAGLASKIGNDIGDVAMDIGEIGEAL